MSQDRHKGREIASANGQRAATVAKFATVQIKALSNIH